MDFSSLTFSAALPEFILIFSALVLVLVVAFGKSTISHVKMVRSLSLLAYAAAFGALFLVPQGTVELFNGMFIIHGLGIYMKGLFLLGGFFACWVFSG